MFLLFLFFWSLVYNSGGLLLLWPLYNCVFLPLQNCLPSCRPLWTNTHPTNIISSGEMRWMEVGSYLVDDPTTRQPGFNPYLDATKHSWIISWPTKATAHPVKRSAALQQLTCALVANAKQCHILPTVQAGGGCSDCTQLMALLPNGWRHMAHKCIRQQQQHCYYDVHNYYATTSITFCFCATSLVVHSYSRLGWVCVP